MDTIKTVARNNSAYIDACHALIDTVNYFNIKMYEKYDSLSEKHQLPKYYAIFEMNYFSIHVRFWDTDDNNFVKRYELEKDYSDEQLTNILIDVSRTVCDILGMNYGDADEIDGTENIDEAIERALEEERNGTR